MWGRGVRAEEECVFLSAHTHTFEMRASCRMLHPVCVILHPRQILNPAPYFFFVVARLFPLQRGHSKKRKFKAETPSSMWPPPLPLQPVCFLKGLSGRRECRPTGWPAGASLLRQSRKEKGAAGVGEGSGRASRGSEAKCEVLARTLTHSGRSSQLRLNFRQLQAVSLGAPSMDVLRHQRGPLRAN